MRQTRTVAYISAILIGMLCILSAPFFSNVSAETKEERRVRLEQELAAIERDIEAKRGDLSVLQRERTSLERDVAILDAQIEKAQLEIRRRTFAIEGIEDDISQIRSTIGSIDERVVKSEASLAELIRRTNEIDEMSLVELALSRGSITDIFEDIDTFEQIQSSLDITFHELAVVREDLTARTEALRSKQGEEAELRGIQELQKRAIEHDEAEKQEILGITKGQEKAYQALIAEREKSAAEIRSALFNLRDTAAIPFGEALQYANEASAKTGVRPALILAILRQETNLGANVGQCLLTNEPNKGDGKGVNTGRLFSGIMKPDRDVDIFMDITRELGIDPYSQVVSCPQTGGYGGAMGPSQFIPSTWVLYKERVARVTGQTPPNPWSPRTAIFATALLMMDNGADGRTYETEHLAALRYFAGWRSSYSQSIRYYGDSVLRYAEEYQGDINILER